MSVINVLPIKWFGDRKAYQESRIKIITVGLNPSDKEFREMDGDPFTSQLRFPDYEVGNEASLEKALNSYFEKNPYRRWFNGGFEHILNGMDASYYSGKKNRALHTDICSPWATTPTWMDLLTNEKKMLMAEGFQQWQQLVNELSPDIILFSIPQEHVKLLKVKSLNELCLITTTKSGEQRKMPVIIQKGIYGRSLAVFGQTWNIPFGSLGKEQKIKLGKQIIGLI